MVKLDGKVVREYREKHRCSLEYAKKVLTKKELSGRVTQAGSIKDLKEVLENIIDCL